MAAGLKGDLGSVPKGFSVPGFPLEADGSTNKWVGEFTKDTDPMCPYIWAIEAMPDTFAVLKNLAHVAGFPSAHFHPINAAMMDKVFLSSVSTCCHIESALRVLLQSSRLQIQS